MAKAKAKDPRNETEAIRTHARNSQLAAGLLLGFHRQLGMWRLCRRKSCKRARACCGNELGCAARRWRAIQSIVGLSTKWRVPARDAENLVDHNVRLWSEVDGVLCRHEEHFFVNMLKGDFVRIFRNNPDGSKEVVFHRDLTDEQSRKLQQEIRRERKAEREGRGYVIRRP
jgi:hypothetical protein